jgi:hypothetical protein
MNVLSGIDVGKALEGVGSIVDELRVTDEERSKAKAELLRVENDLTSKVLDYEKTVANAQRDVLVAEANSQSWIARNWRPILMLSITFLLVHKFFLFPYLSKWWAIPELEFPPELFTLLTVGVGGYIVGRSGEKIAKTMRESKVASAEQVGEQRAQRRDLKARGRETRRLARIARKFGWSDEDLERRLAEVLR